MGYTDELKKIASEIINARIEEPEVEKVATETGDTEVELDVVEKMALSMLQDIEKEAEDADDARLSDKAIETLGLEDVEKEEEDDKDDKDDEDDEEDDDTKEASDSSVDADIKVATERLAQAFLIEKEANEALQEAELMKVASCRVLAACGAIEESDVEKIASLNSDSF